MADVLGVKRGTQERYKKISIFLSMGAGARQARRSAKRQVPIPRVRETASTAISPATASSELQPALFRFLADHIRVFISDLEPVASTRSPSPALSDTLQPLLQVILVAADFRVTANLLARAALEMVRHFVGHPPRVGLVAP